jgi:hypothetical protein
MLTAVYSSEDKGVRVKDMTIQFATVSQFEDTLTDLDCSTVDLIQEEGNRIITSGLEPIWWVEGSGVPVSRGKTNQVSLSHLRGSSFHYRHAQLTSNLVYNLGLTNTVTTTDKNRLADCCDMGSHLDKCAEINSHNLFSPS